MLTIPLWYETQSLLSGQCVGSVWCAVVQCGAVWWAQSCEIGFWCGGVGAKVVQQNFTIEKEWVQRLTLIPVLLCEYMLYSKLDFPMGSQGVNRSIDIFLGLAKVTTYSRRRGFAISERNHGRHTLSISLFACSYSWLFNESYMYTCSAWWAHLAAVKEQIQNL